MLLRRTLFLLSASAMAALVACGSDDQATGPTTSNSSSGGSTSSSSSGGDGPEADGGGGTGSGDGSVGKADAGGDSFDGGKDPLVPSPPPGFTKCKSGPITSETALAACETFEESPNRTKACSGATLTGGSWELWCKGDERWAWARFEGVALTATFPTCPGGSAIGGASQRTTKATGSGAGDWATAACKGHLGSCTLKVGGSAVVTMAKTSTAGPQGARTQTFFVTGSADVFSCLPPAPDPYPRALLGVTIDLE